MVSEKPIINRYYCPKCNKILRSVVGRFRDVVNVEYVLKYRKSLDEYLQWKKIDEDVVHSELKELYCPYCSGKVELERGTYKELKDLTIIRGI